MAQLKMYWLPGTPIANDPLPEGYSFSNFSSDEDRLTWGRICLDGLLADDCDLADAYEKRITARTDIIPERDLFFLDYLGEHIGTITAYIHRDKMIGDVHMVSIRTDFRGRGLQKYMMQLALRKLEAEGARYVFLTTDEWRRAAVKGYLSAGFLPVEYDIGMQDRWEAVLEEHGIDSVQMLYEDATPYKVIHRESLNTEVVRFGVFGAGRGRTMMEFCRHNRHAKLVAVCDMYDPALDPLREIFQGQDVTFYNDFDSFIQHDMDCVVLANYANEHAPFAIRAMEAGKNVLSEVLPIQCMKEAVELIEAVERTGKVYAYAENYCFMPAPKKMRKMYRAGKLGTFEYGEGEYMHNCETIWPSITHGTPEHWRNLMNAFFYCTHSLGPILHITGLRPVSVSGFEGAYNARMERMGAVHGPFGVEMVTLENGGLVKSLHGVGPARSSVWYSIYGSKGRLESAREDACLPENPGVKTLYSKLDKNEGDNNGKVVIENVRDGLSDFSGNSGHGGSDYYVMYNVVERLRGNRNAEIVDVYEALDMFLPGLFAYRSALAGGMPMAIPDLRDPAEREKWRNDVACNDPAVAGDALLPTASRGAPAIPPETYDRCAEQYDGGKRRAVEQAYYHNKLTKKQ